MLSSESVVLIGECKLSPSTPNLYISTLMQPVNESNFCSTCTIVMLNGDKERERKKSA